MDRLTKGELLHQCIRYIGDIRGAFTGEEQLALAKGFRDLALHSLSQKAVRDEALEENYAEIGRDFCEQILKWEPDYCWNQSPLEYLTRLVDQRDEALSALKREPNAALGMEHPNSAGAGPAPAAPEVETPEVDAVAQQCVGQGSPMSYVRAIDLARSLERRLSQASEGLFNAGLHYDELLAHNQENATALSLAQTEIKGHMRVVDELKECLGAAVAKIEELEKDAARLDWLHAELKLTIAHALHWPVTPQDTVSFRAKIDAALKSRA